MSLKSIGLIVLLILSIATAVMLLANRESPAPDESAAVEEGGAPTPPPPATPAPGKPATPPVEDRPVPPTPGADALQTPEAFDNPEDLEDDAQIEQEQINSALSQLASPDVAQRVEGAEQLGAYPTKEAEAALLQALASDSEPEVRSAAAQSLGYVEKPTEGTIGGLVSALEDSNDDVRLNALSTLEDFLLSSEENSKRYKKILGALKARADSRSVPQDTRDAIRDILQDLQSTAPPQ
jgi:HEAT repeat protein